MKTTTSDGADDRRRSCRPAIESAPRPGPTVRSSTMVSVGGQRAGAQQHGEVVGALDREAAGDLAGAAEDRLADLRRRDHLVVEHDGEGPADILLGRLAEALRALESKRKMTTGSLVRWSKRRLRVDEVLAGHDDAVLDQVGDRRIVGRVHDRRAGRRAALRWPPAPAPSGRPAGRSASRSGRGCPSGAAGPAGPAPAPGCGRRPGAG